MSRRDLVGTWKSADGGIIELKGDGTFCAAALDIRKLYWTLAINEKVNKIRMCGTWSLAHVNDRAIVVLEISRGSLTSVL